MFAFGHIAPTDELARLRVNALDEVDVLHTLPDVLHLQIAIVNEYEATLVRVHDVFLSVALEHNKLAHCAVEVPGVVGQFLMVELELAGIGIEP